MDSNLPEWPTELPTPLVDRLHSILPRSRVTRMESGRSRVRRSFTEPIEVMEVTWNFTEDQYVAFQTFFQEEIENGSLPFVMETLEPSPTEGKVRRWARS